MSRNNDFTTVNLLGYLCHQTHYYWQKNTSIPLQISFVEKLQENDSATIFFITEKQQKTILNFSLDSLVVTE